MGQRLASSIQSVAVTCWLLICAAAAPAPAPAKEPTVHTVITTECSPYFTWQTMGVVYSHKRSGMPGHLTRLMSCPEEEAPKYQSEYSLVRTHVVPSLTINKEHDDVYSAYNKPGAVLRWIEDTDPEEDFILVIDADMIMRTPFNPVKLGAKPGTAISAFFGYMKGVSNELALKHVPQVIPRNDSLAGPVGRRGDQVGGFALMATSDLKKVAPLWLNYTIAVRYDPDAWNLTGDQYSIHEHDRPWISEMYGYSFAAAVADVWHKVDYSAMLYPGYFATDEEDKQEKEKMVRMLMKLVLKKSTDPSPPKVLHYGLLYEVPNTGYKFDKHWHYNFDPLVCPPWNITVERPKGGLFPHPPHPASFQTKGLDLLRDLLAVEPIIILNAAFCEHHVAHCPVSEELATECGKVADMLTELDSRTAVLQFDLVHEECGDRDERCPRWAQDGECIANPGYMHTSCRKSCNKCPTGTDVKSTRGEDEEEESGPATPTPTLRPLNAAERIKFADQLNITGEALKKGKTIIAAGEEVVERRQAADSIWAAQKRVAHKVNAADSVGAPAVPARPKTGKPTHKGIRHKKWFRGRERAVDTAEVVSEGALERLMEATDTGEDSGGDEPIDGNGSEGLVDSESRLDTQDVISQHHHMGFTRTGLGARAWWRGRASSQQLVLGRTEAMRSRAGAHTQGMEPAHLRNLSSLLFWLGCMGLGAWLFAVVWMAPRRKKAALSEPVKAVARGRTTSAPRKKRGPSRSTSSKIRNV